MKLQLKLLIGMAVLSLLAAAPLCAQEQEKEKPPQQEQEQKTEKPKADKHPPAEKPQQESKPPKTDKSKEPQENKQTEIQEKEQQKHPDKEAQKPQHSSQSGRPGGARHGKRIPDETFHAHFGREHRFHVARSGGNQFFVSGFTFEFVDPWPADWSFDDDCYIELIGDDYFLFDVVHPGVRILVIVIS